MSVKQVRTLALAATLLAGTTALAYAQSGSAPMGTGGAPAKHGESNTATGGKHESHGAVSTTGAGGPSASGEMKKGDEEKASSMKKDDEGKAPAMKGEAGKSAAGNKAETGKGEASKSTEQGKSAAGGNATPSAENGKAGKANTTNSTMGKSEQSGTTGKGDNASQAAGTHANVNLTTQQKTVIKNTVIENKSAPRVSHVDFSVSVGVVVPTTVHYAPLPDSIVEIHPAWRGYDYFVYEDQVIVIEPRSHKIIEIIVVS